MDTISFSNFFSFIFTFTQCKLLIRNIFLLTSDFWGSLPKNKRPSIKSDINVKKAVDDDVTKSKLSFFSYLASLMEPYLRRYQCDKRMIFFMFNDLKKMFLSLLRIIVKDSIITGKTARIEGN